MRSELTRSRSHGFNGPNWRGVGRVEVDADLGAGIGPGTMLVDFDRRRIAAGGLFLVAVYGVPELLQFKRFPRGLRARIGARWVAVAHDDLRGCVVGRVVTINQANV